MKRRRRRGRIDPRTLSIALDDMLPAQRTVAVDSGNFMGYPAMYLDVPGADGFVLHPGLPVDRAGARDRDRRGRRQPGRLTVAALGDGGLLMGDAELETAIRLGLDLLVVVYDDRPTARRCTTSDPTAPPSTPSRSRRPTSASAAASAARGHRARPGDLDVVAAWLAGPRDRPMVVDAKVTSGEPSWWLAEAFRGH